MYAVVRTGGKQYRVAPGDVIKVESFQAGDNGQVEFEPLAVSTEEGKLAGPGSTRVLGQVLELRDQIHDSTLKTTILVRTPMVPMSLAIARSEIEQMQRAAAL